MFSHTLGVWEKLQSSFAPACHLCYDEENSGPFRFSHRAKGGIAMLSGLLTTFLSVAKYRGFTRAAEELYTTQPTISRQIHQLEKDCRRPGSAPVK